jgi:hypothetical protein
MQMKRNEGDIEFEIREISRTINTLILEKSNPNITEERKTDIDNIIDLCRTRRIEVIQSLDQ